jgi:cytochrome c biogenesis protein CcmG, thiol:disulfide interchange protein DsbE
MSGNRRWLVIGGVGVVLVAALAIAFSTGEPAPEELPEAAVSISGERLALFSDPSADLAVGATAPTAVGTDFAGVEVRIEPTGEPTAVVFLAHWCSHCQAEVPRIVDLQERGGTDGVRLVAIATANDPIRPNYPASDWLERERWVAPVLVDDAESSLGAAFGLSSYPFIVVLDGAGEVMFRVAGELDSAGLEQLFAIARQG